MKKVILGLLMVLTLSACSGGMMGGEDKYSTTYIKSHIVEGKTTKSEVQGLYGVPDSNSESAYGTTWRFNKNGDMKDASSLAGYIPGASAITSALGMADTASSASDSYNKVQAKRSGNSAITHGSSLYITFNRSGVVDYWSLD
ncbi:hypothetical protein PMPD1_0754 [Paramixta manurensis]|uniref:Lipoprotein n=1 Tax=Paramixta manurensis TaxID=2740817 RepID=A0A6M8U4Z4_9GAMM|nr:hypothetical protein PMPD1_0754 [Erwiniaceae bacterium PD-1]